MITPQDIREKTFEKAVFGGYDMGAVDDFLEECASDLTLLQKENATLKNKMKMLVEEIDKHRAKEDDLQEAILSVQKMGSQIEKEAREKSDRMLSDARKEARRITREAGAESELEKTKLEEARRSSVQFIENMNLLCKRQMDFLSRLNNTDFVREMRRQLAETESARALAQPSPAAGNSEPHESIRTGAGSGDFQESKPAGAGNTEFQEKVRPAAAVSVPVNGAAQEAAYAPDTQSPSEQPAAKSGDGAVHIERKQAAGSSKGLDSQTTRTYDIVSGGADSNLAESGKAKPVALEARSR